MSDMKSITTSAKGKARPAPVEKTAGARHPTRLQPFRTVQEVCPSILSVYLQSALLIHSFSASSVSNCHPSHEYKIGPYGRGVLIAEQSSSVVLDGA
jgi:hypothetical protein